MEMHEDITRVIDKQLQRLFDPKEFDTKSLETLFIHGKWLGQKVQLGYIRPELIWTHRTNRKYIRLYFVAINYYGDEIIVKHSSKLLFAGGKVGYRHAKRRIAQWVKELHYDCATAEKFMEEDRRDNYVEKQD